MGNLYDFYATLLGIEYNTSGYNTNVIYVAGICAIVLFTVAIKIIYKGFNNLCGYNKCIR